MNIETANRLYELRKKNGLSQEELADKLGISRQAVSKWERAEASPDTDNLILLAKLYGVTLDELLNSDTAVDLASENAKSIPLEENICNEFEEEQNDSSKKESINLKEKKERNPLLDIVSGIVVFVSIILYLVLGFTVPKYGWSCYWVVFLFIPIITSLFEAITERRICKFLYPVLVAAVYCFLGLRFSDLEYTMFGQKLYGLWHPFWILFLTIPLYYAIVGPLDNCLHKTDKKNVD